jgi:non-ribosomal peptide synthetase component F
MDHISSAVEGEELSILNTERKTLPGPEFLHDLIRWSGTSVNAIDFWTASGDIYHISYKALDDQTSALANQIAAALVASRIDREDVIIPVLIPQSPELYVSWIAILKAGAAFCPIAIDSPAERVRFILQDVSASVVITNASHEEWLADISPDIKILSVSQRYLHSTSRPAPFSVIEATAEEMAPRPESLAYIMYTSGQ